ncbi:peptidoglycan-binding protein [Roseovarius salis]|uniref:peptidoglycan-binding domain-containing protein n=1 Tax=Roseovarius salis TaxID=3376063 RepID=UPI0037C958C9
MKTGPVIAALLAALSLGGCQTSLPDLAPPERMSTRDKAPPWAAPGTCWGKDETPAVIETVTEQVMLQPAQVRDDGTVTEPAAYKTETRQKIVKPRKDTWFETPCEDQLTPQFNASLQRALKARGHYRGPVTGRMDRRTRAAIRAYQKPQGLDSAMISLAAARQMGLVTVESSDAPEGETVQLRPRGRQTSLLRPEQMADERQMHPRPEGQSGTAAEKAARPDAAAASAGRRKSSPDAAAGRTETPRNGDARPAPATDLADAPAAQTGASRRAAELDAALAAEKAADQPASRPLPISSETY